MNGDDNKFFDFYNRRERQKNVLLSVPVTDSNSALVLILNFRKVLPVVADENHTTKGSRANASTSSVCMSGY